MYLPFHVIKTSVSWGNSIVSTLFQVHQNRKTQDSNCVHGAPHEAHRRIRPRCGVWRWSVLLWRGPSLSTMDRQFHLASRSYTFLCFFYLVLVLSLHHRQFVMISFNQDKNNLPTQCKTMHLFLQFCVIEIICRFSFFWPSQFKGVGHLASHVHVSKVEYVNKGL